VDPHCSMASMATLRMKLKDAGKNMRDIKRMEKKTDEKCDLCGSPLLAEVGKIRQLLCLFGL